MEVRLQGYGTNTGESCVGKVIKRGKDVITFRIHDPESGAKAEGQFRLRDGMAVGSNTEEGFVIPASILKKLREGKGEQEKDMARSTKAVAVIEDEEQEEEAVPVPKRNGKAPAPVKSGAKAAANGKKSLAKAKSNVKPKPKAAVIEDEDEEEEETPAPRKRGRPKGSGTAKPTAKAGKVSVEPKQEKPASTGRRGRPPSIILPTPARGEAAVAIPAKMYADAKTYFGRKGKGAEERAAVSAKLKTAVEKNDLFHTTLNKTEAESFLRYFEESTPRWEEMGVPGGGMKRGARRLAAELSHPFKFRIDAETGYTLKAGPAPKAVTPAPAKTAAKPAAKPAPTVSAKGGVVKKKPGRPKKA